MMIVKMLLDYKKVYLLSHIVISLFFANSQKFCYNNIMIDGQIQNTELVPNRSAHGEDSVEILSCY